MPGAEKQGSYVLGIDLGTTYTAAAIKRAGQEVDSVDLGDRATSIPSVVSVREDGTTVVGEQAERRLITDPARSAREFKRRLGDSTPLVLGGTPWSAESLQGEVLKAVVDKVTEQEGSAPTKVVVSHPAAYSNFKRDLVKDAARLAGIEKMQLISEPEAAAVFYATKQPLDTGDVVAVYDLGGGTFDVALLRRTDTGFELVGKPEGIERFGGVDADQAVFAHVDEALDGQAGALDPNDPTARAALGRLREECRLAKEALSSETETDIACVLPTVTTSVRLTRGEFESMMRPRLDDTVAMLERTVKNADLAMTDIARILLVGGMSRMPLIAELIERATGRPVAVDLHPKLAVCMGAALAAEARPKTATKAAAAKKAPAKKTAPTKKAAAVLVEAQRVPTPLPTAPPAVVATSAKQPLDKRVLIGAAIVLVVVLIGGVAAAMGGGGDKKDDEKRAFGTTTSDSVESTTSIIATTTPPTTPPTTFKPAVVTTPPTAAPPTTVPAEVNLTLGRGKASSGSIAANLGWNERQTQEVANQYFVYRSFNDGDYEQIASGPAFNFAACSRFDHCYTDEYEYEQGPKVCYIIKYSVAAKNTNGQLGPAVCKNFSY